MEIVKKTPELSFLRKQESSVFLFTNEGKSKDPGFPITNVGNDGLDRGVLFSSLAAASYNLHDGFYWLYVSSVFRLC